MRILLLLLVKLDEIGFDWPKSLGLTQPYVSFETFRVSVDVYLIMFQKMILLVHKISKVYNLCYISKWVSGRIIYISFQPSIYFWRVLEARHTSDNESFNYLKARERWKKRVRVTVVEFILFHRVKN